MKDCFCDKPGHCYWHDAVVDEQDIERCRHGETPLDPSKYCVHLGSKSDVQRRRIDLPIYNCRLFGECTLQQSKISSCCNCMEKLTIDDPKLKDRWKDPLRIVDRSGSTTNVLRNFLSGGAAFLVCGGPSLNHIDMSLLKQRGIFSLGINNVAAYAPVSAFICSDPPSKFHNGIFLDPKIMKLLPIPKLIHRKRGLLRTKLSDGTFDWMETSTMDCPNTWGFERRSWLKPDDTWFIAEGAAWGNHQMGVLKTGEEKTVNTMFLGIRLLQYLGAKIIFLLGVDFFMNPIKGPTENYSFGEERDEAAIDSNNRQYVVANDWLCRLRPVFEKFGYRVFNCNQSSHLRAFDYVPFEKALKVCKGKIPDEPWDLKNWYKK